MTNISIKKDNSNIKEILIKGHTGYDEIGKDIVCSSISSIVITTVNVIIRIDEYSIDYKEKDGFISIKILKNNKYTNILIENMLDLLKELEQQYSKNVKINEEV